ncbi:unnamed protein product [Cunninghamella blakesleeana]
MVYGSGLQRGGIKNPKLNEQADENVDTATYNKAGLHQSLANKASLHSSTVHVSTKKSLTVTNEPKRSFLTDKSNCSSQQPSKPVLGNKEMNQPRRLQELEYVLLPNTQLKPTLPSRKKTQEPTTSHIDNNDKNNNNDSNNNNTNNDNNSNILSSKQQNITSSTHDINNDKYKVKPNVENEANEEDVNAFFEDNKQRYSNHSKENKTSMDPTPILPIVVPDRIKSLVRERHLSASSLAAASSIKRSYEGIYQRGEQLISNLKKQKSVHDRDPHQGIDTSEKENIDPNQLGKPIIKSSLLPSTSTSTSTLSSSSLNNHNTNIKNIHNTNTNNNNNISHNNNSNINHPHHLKQQHSSKPIYNKLQKNDYQPTEFNVDQDTYNEAKEMEKEQELRSQNNLTQLSSTGRHLLTGEESGPLYDPMLVTEYADDIHSHLCSIESKILADPNYIKEQHEITWRMRSVLIDWVMEVHYIFQLLPETLFLTVNIIDRFLSNRDVSLCKLQLVGIGALFVATKFEETASPSVKQYLYMTGDTITEEDLLKAERFILSVLDFKLCYPNPLQFLRRSAMIGNFDLHIRMLAKYFMEISCVDYRFIPIVPSKIAAASLWLATKMLCKGSWTPELIRASGYTVQDLKPTVELMLDYLSQHHREEAFHKKWATKRMMRISTFVRDWVRRFYQQSAAAAAAASSSSSSSSSSSTTASKP